MRTNVRTALLAVMASSLATAACETRTVYVETSRSAPQAYAPQQAAPAAQQIQRQNLLDPTAFDLETVTGLLRTNQVQNAQSLEQLINSRPGINNVDVDGDGQIDYIGVQESVNGNSRQFAFVACPSSQNGQNVTVATVTFTDLGGQIQVAGGYTPVVMGYDTMYYSYYVPRASFGQMMFYAWLFSARPYYVYHPYGFGWHARPMLGGSALRTSRTETRTQMHVAPIQRSAPPAGYSERAAAAQQPSRLAPAPRSTAPGLNGAAGNMRDFKERDNAQPKLQGNSFGGGARSAAPAAAAPAPTPAFRAATPPPAFKAPAPAPARPAPSFRAPSAPSFGGGSRGKR